MSCKTSLWRTFLSLCGYLKAYGDEHYLVMQSRVGYLKPSEQNRYPGERVCCPAVAIRVRQEREKCHWCDYAEGWKTVEASPIHSLTMNVNDWEELRRLGEIWLEIGDNEKLTRRRHV